MEPTDLRYPQHDPRFQHVIDDMTQADAEAWTADFPPTPVTVSGEAYMDFVKRQTAYAAYRNSVVVRRDWLKAQEKRLQMPKAPVGEDIEAVISWISSTGETPIEFLTKAYRSATNTAGERISAASKLLEYVHRKLPQRVEVSGADALTVGSFNPAALAQLSDEELDDLETILTKTTKTTKTE